MTADRNKRQHMRPERFEQQKGAALIYYIATLVVLGILAASMLTLFDSSTQIATHVNHPKIAFYMAESGVRYVQTQMKGPGSISQKMGDINAVPLYNVDTEQSFEAKVYTLAAFESANTNLVPANQTVTLTNVSDDPFPDGYEVPSYGSSADDLYLVSNQDMDFLQALNNARVLGSTMSSDRTEIYLTLQDALEPDQVGRRYYLACQAITGNNNVYQGDSVTVNGCGDYFPDKNGIITIFSHDYVYTEKVDNGNGTYTLTNLQKPPDADGNEQTWQSGFTTAKIPGDDLKGVGNGDFIVLNSENHLNMYGSVIGFSGPTGEQSEFEMQANFVVAEDQRQTKDKITHHEPHKVVTSDPSKNPITPTGDPGINLGAGQLYAFGASWYSGTKHGVNLYCVDGECDFGFGLRTFFTVNFDTSYADGFVFAVMNGDNNTNDDIGGDSALGELIGFAGDSRVYGTWNGSWDWTIGYWIDPNRDGILPPKFGVEFDPYTNAGNNCICTVPTPRQGASTRLDPTPRHTQHTAFAFWGDDAESGCVDKFLCKDQVDASGTRSTDWGEESYDDNKHGSGDNTTTANAFVATDNRQKWYTTGTSYLYAVRIEMHRSLEPEDDTSSPNYGKYEYNFKVWINRCSQADNCQAWADDSDADGNGVLDNTGTIGDLEGDILGNNTGDSTFNPVLEKTLWLTDEANASDSRYAYMHTKLNTVYFGFTEATGAATQDALITNYAVKFRSGGDDNFYLEP